jgi:uncharacterized protein YdeI (YjbR/CyaY-like superfamily)
MSERAMITDPAEFFAKGCGRCERFATPDCSTRPWLAGLEGLRRICLDVGLSETAKWGHPCYMHAGRNIAVMGAFRGDFRLNFVHAALLKDPEGVLEPQGPNSARPSMLRFTDNAEVAALEPVIRAYLKEAMGYAEAGIVPEKEAADIELPDELVEALDDDPELAEAFHALTPGRQRSYVFALNTAKQSATRVARIAKFRDRIIAGKGALER